MYTAEMDWSTWKNATTNVINDMQKSFSDGLLIWEKFNAMTYGLTDPDILALNAFKNKSQADLDAIRSAINTIKSLYDAYTGAAALAQYSYKTYMIPFEG